MDEKKATKISLSTFFLFLAIIIIMGFFMYKFYNDKTIETQIATDLQSQTNSLNATIGDLQTKINTISEDTTSISETNNIKYDELTKSLDSGDVLYVTKAEKNLNNTYTLYGVVFKCNKNVYPDFQISDTWTITDEYKKITVDSNTLCISGYPEEEETTVAEYFANYGEKEIEEYTVNTNPNDKATYSFEFKNGKCVKVIDYCTAI